MILCQSTNTSATIVVRALKKLFSFPLAAKIRPAPLARARTPVRKSLVSHPLATHSVGLASRQAAIAAHWEALAEQGNSITGREPVFYSK